MNRFRYSDRFLNLTFKMIVNIIVIVNMFIAVSMLKELLPDKPSSEKAVVTENINKDYLVYIEDNMYYHVQTKDVYVIIDDEIQYIDCTYDPNLRQFSNKGD